MEKRKWILILVIEALIFIGIFGWMKSCDNQTIDKYKQNYEVSQDSLEIIKMKNGNLLYEREAYIMSEKELMAQLDISKSEIKDLKKKVGDLLYISNIDTKIQIDTIHTIKDSIIYIDRNMFIDKFKYYDEWLSLDGTTHFMDSTAKTTINNIEMITPLRVGLSKDYKIFVESPNPYLSITNIEGAVLEESKIIKKQRWSHGIHLGFGIQYGIISKTLDIGPQLGYSLHFNL